MFKKFLFKLFNKYQLLSKFFFKRRVIKNKRLLNEQKNNFTKFSDVLFVFQVYNNQQNIKHILNPFLEKKVENILAFADGCIDKSSSILHSLLKGKNHYVIQANDLHEINNYRISLDISESLGCKFVVLLQDDDVFSESIFDWLDNCCIYMNQENISITGGLSGLNLCTDFSYKKGDSTLINAKFESYKDERGIEYYQLGKFEKGIISNLKSTKNGTNKEYVAYVNRAPQIINVSIAKKLGFFPKILEPFQYDDHYNCFISWINNYKVLFVPFSDIKSIGTSGMRFFNNVKITSRPTHFINNWNTILNIFGSYVNDGTIQEKVRKSNLS